MDLFGLVTGLARSRSRDELEGCLFLARHRPRSPNLAPAAKPASAKNSANAPFNSSTSPAGVVMATPTGALRKKSENRISAEGTGLSRDDRLRHRPLQKAGREPPCGLAVLQRLHRGRQLLAQLGFEGLFALAALAGRARQAIECGGGHLSGKGVLGRCRMLAVGGTGERAVGARCNRAPRPLSR